MGEGGGREEGRRGRRREKGGGERREEERRKEEGRRERRKMKAPNPAHSKYDKRRPIDPPGWSLLLGFLHEVDKADKVDHKLEEDSQKCVEVEDVGKRALL